MCTCAAILHAGFAEVGLLCFVLFYSCCVFDLGGSRLGSRAGIAAVIVAITIVTAQITLTSAFVHWLAGPELTKRIALLRRDWSSGARAMIIGAACGVPLGIALLALSVAAFPYLPQPFQQLAAADTADFVARPAATIVFGALYAAVMDTMCIRALNIVGVATAFELVAKRLRIWMLPRVGPGCCGRGVRGAFDALHPEGALRSAGFRWWGATLLACVVDLFLPQPGRLLGVGGLSAVTAQSWYGQGASIFTPPLIAYFAIGTLVHGVALSALARRWGFEAAAAAAGLSLATVNVYDVFVSSGDAGEFSFIYRYFFLRISQFDSP